MATHVALLRGINVGGRNKIAMDDLRGVVSGLGYDDVSTYIQTGNVLFTPTPDEAGADAIADKMKAAIFSELGVTAPVVVLSREELAEAVAANPFPEEEDHKRLHAVFLARPAGRELLNRIGSAVTSVAAKGSHDSAKTIGRTLYLHTPDGYGTSDLAKALLLLTSSPQAGTGTARNWSTTLKLLEMCG